MKPILFNTEMVKGILEGRKTTTRRIVKPQPKQPIPLGFVSYSTDSKNEGYFGWGKDKYGGIIDCAKPPYKVEDILYVRETFIKSDDGYCYKADIKVPSESEDLRKAYGYKWKPSIHMPKEAARIFLKVTDVRVERLLDMSIEDMIREGVKVSDITTNRGIIGYRVANRFQELWDSTIKKKELDMYGMDANPWVWVIKFERVEGVKNESCYKI